MNRNISTDWIRLRQHQWRKNLRAESLTPHYQQAIRDLETVNTPSSELFKDGTTILSSKIVNEWYLLGAGVNRKTDRLVATLRCGVRLKPIGKINLDKPNTRWYHYGDRLTFNAEDTLPMWEYGWEQLHDTFTRKREGQVADRELFGTTLATGSRLLFCVRRTPKGYWYCAHRVRPGERKACQTFQFPMQHAKKAFPLLLDYNKELHRYISAYSEHREEVKGTLVGQLLRDDDLQEAKQRLLESEYE